ncbi:conjugal transfer protein TraN [Serratia marcescens]|nr:conjugal transfer protein TraN [Serratia marcescens]
MTIRNALSRTLLGSLLAACAATPAIAGDNDMSEGEAAASAALSGALQGAGQVKPEQYFDRYTDNPPESGYYHGGTQTDTDIGAKGQQALAQTELGKEMRKSFINNPADKIDYDADMIKRSDDIRKDADVIAAGVGPQCVKQVLNKVSYTSHACEKAQSVAAQCHNTANIVGDSAESTKEEWFTVGVLDAPFREEGGHIIASVTPSLTGDILEAYYSYTGFGRYATRNVTLLGTAFVENLAYSANNVRFYPAQTHFDAGQPFTVSHPKSYSGRGSTSSSKPINAQLRFKMRVKTHIYRPRVEWTASCGVDKENAVMLREYCSQGAETRTVWDNGVAYPVYQDCWQTTQDWQLYESDDNSCGRWESDRNCTVGTRRCLQRVGDFCVRESLSYQCQHTVSGQGWLCGDKFYCDDGSCASIKDEKNNDFKAAVSQLAALAAAGKDVAGLDPNTIRFFTGKPMSCRKTAIGFSNCCKGGGWGHGVGLAHCNDEEKAIGKAKARKLVIDVGEYCSKKVLGACLQKKHSYCVYDSLLARIVQEQGRQGQLGIGFGSGKNPDCRGMVMAEFERLKFDHIDFSDFYDELQGKVKLPDQDALSARIREQISRNIQKGSN